MDDPSHPQSSLRTTGSADFKNFVKSCLDDLSWNLSGQSPAGLGLVRLRRLHSFLIHVCTLPASRRRNFGPTRGHISNLRQRLLAMPPSDAPSKALLFDIFEKEMATVLSSWPPTLPADAPPPVLGAPVEQAVADTDAPAAPNPVTFYANLAADAANPFPVLPTVSKFPSVLFDVLKPGFDLPPQDVAARLLDEAAVFSPVGSSNFAMSAVNFTTQRQSVKLSLEQLCNVPVPNTILDDTLRAAMRNFLIHQYNCTRQIMVDKAAATAAAAAAAVTPPPAPVPAVSHMATLQRNFTALVDHINHAGGAPTDLSLSPADALPSYVSRTFERSNPALLVVPDVVSEALHARDKAMAGRLEFLHSLANVDGKCLHPDIDLYFQKYYCAADMNIVGLETTVPASQRAAVCKDKIKAQDDLRRLLDIRMQRFRLQKRKLGDAISKAEIEDLKSREFRVFSDIRMRFRSMLAGSAQERLNALAGVTAASDTVFAQASFGASAAQAKTLLVALHKSRVKRKRPVKVTRAYGFTAPAKVTGSSRTCHHCGVSGANYHPFYKCPKWKAGSPPVPGTKYASLVASGKTVPKVKKKKK